MKKYEKYLGEAKDIFQSGKRSIKWLESRPSGMSSFLPEKKHWKGLRTNLDKIMELAEHYYNKGYMRQSLEHMAEAIALIQDFQMRMD